MRKVISLAVVLITLLNCSVNEHEKKLIGQWNNFPIGGSSDVKFYEDSIVSVEYGEKRVGKWSANSLLINIHNRVADSEGRKDFTLFYKISNNGDTLLTKNDTILKELSYMPLLKVNDNWKHYLREIKLDIDLPEPNSGEFKSVSSNLGIDIYAGYQNDSLVLKTYGGALLRDFSRIKALVYSVKSEKNREDIDNLYFSLIIDKAVPESKVDSIKSFLKHFPEIKIFRVFHDKNANYGKYPISMDQEMWNWYGKYE